MQAILSDICMSRELSCEDHIIPGEGIVKILKSDMKMPHKQRHRAKRIWERLTSYPKNHLEKGPTSLEWHGNPIEIRNIWIRKVGGCDEKQS